jgi:hypothetical protein
VKNRTNAALLIATTVWLIASIAAAQTKPDFSGAWKIKSEKSKIEAIDDIRNIIFKIKHKDPGFSQSVIVTRGGGDQTFEEKYTTDGKESDVKISSGTVKATAKWEGDTLTIEHKSETGAILNRRKYTLSADGKTLTLTVRYFTTNGEIDETTVLEKATVVTKPYLIR